MCEIRVTLRGRPNNVLSNARLCVLLAISCFLTVVPALRAQVDTGAILGTVRDQSGAVIPGANVTVTNINTSFSLTAHTDARGAYIFTPLMIGTYKVQAGFQGFQTVIRQPISVSIQQQAVVDFTLNPGRVTQQVEVSGNAPLLQTQNASRGGVIGARQINNLPLNGRNFTLLAQLVPGTTTIAQESRGLIQSGSFIANGVDVLFNNYLLDGLDNNNNTVDFLNGAAFAVLPPPDAIQEFKIQTSNFNAEFGRAGGAVLNATVKSGTNQLHGDAWEFVRNDKLDAADYFLNAGNQSKGEFRRNQFGFTLGGPVVIPHVYNGRNKTFFFGDYSATRIRQGQPFVSTVPTANERGTGYTDLTDLITGQSGTVPNDILGRSIPTGTVFDPATTRPVTAGTVDPVTGLTATRNGYAGDPFYLSSCGSVAGVTDFTTQVACLNQLPAGRLDLNAIKLLNLFPAPNQSGLFNNYVSNPVKMDDTNAFDVRVDQNFSERDQMFERTSFASEPTVLPTPCPGLAACGQSFAEGTQSNKNFSTVLSETHTFSPSMVNEFRLGYHRIHTERLQPNGNVGGINAQYGIPGVPDGPPNGGLTQIKISGLSELGGHNNLPLNEISDDYQLTDNVTKIYKSHTIKAGFEYQRMRVAVYSASFPHGWWIFGGIPNFLITPIPATVPNGIDNVGGASNVRISPLGQEDYRRPYYATYVQDDWKVARKLTLNLGLRWEYYALPHDRHDRLANIVPGAPFNGAQYLIDEGSKDITLSPSFLQNLQSNGIQLVYSSNRPLGYAQKTNFAPRVGFAFQASPKLVFRGAYGIFYTGIFNAGDGGNLGNNYPFNFNLEFNPPDSGHPITPDNSIGILSNGFSNVPLDPSLAGGVGLTLQGQELHTATPYTQEANFTTEYELTPNQVVSLGYVGSFGRHLMATPGLNIPSEILPPNVNPQNYVPYPGFARNTFGYSSRQGSSYFHSLQVKFERRFSNGLNMLGAYTWSKARSDVYDQLIGGHTWRAPYLPGFGIQGDYGLANYDVRNAFHFSGGYELPFGTGRTHPFTSNAANALAGGWSVNWILTLQSGPPFTVGCTVGTVAGMGCVGLLVPGQGLYTGGHTVANWLNAAAFANPPIATTVGQSDYAPLGGAVTQAAGPGLHRFDLGIIKQFHVSERVYFEFRGDFFNLTNTPNFSLPGSLNFSSPKNFSQITRTRDNPDDPREIQLGLKLYF
jgi:Carboxypeptidase regulatory-like domain